MDKQDVSHPTPLGSPVIRECSTPALRPIEGRPNWFYNPKGDEEEPIYIDPIAPKKEEPTKLHPLTSIILSIHADPELVRACVKEAISDTLRAQFRAKGLL